LAREVRRDLHAVATVLSTGNGIKLLLAVLVIEVITGFRRIVLWLQDGFHRSAADRSFARFTLASPTSWRHRGPSWCFSGLGVFWTAVKSEYRTSATGITGSQAITSSLTRACGRAGRQGDPPRRHRMGTGDRRRS